MHGEYKICTNDSVWDAGEVFTKIVIHELSLEELFRWRDSGIEWKTVYGKD